MTADIRSYRTVSRDRAATLAALIGVTVLSWLYLHHLAAQGMPAMNASAGAALSGAMRALPASWTLLDFALMFAMWWVMMTGMMLPGATPMILTFATVNRRKRERGRPHLPTFVFSAGYLLAWGGFSLLATVAQWWLDRAHLLLPLARVSGSVPGGLLFLAAGLYQWTPLKHACLAHCRSPLDFVVNRWRDGWIGALRMGCEHGAYCLGCCAVLMILLFVGGAMNLLWTAALAFFVFIEKLCPAGIWTARASGALMAAIGVWLLAAG